MLLPLVVCDVSYLGYRQAVSQATYSIVASPAYEELTLALAEASARAPSLPVPTGGYPSLGALEADYLLSCREQIIQGGSPVTFGFSAMLPAMKSVAVAFARNVSAALISQYADNKQQASKAYNAFLGRFSTLESASPRAAFSANPQISAIFGPFSNSIVNGELYGTHGVGAAWLRTGMSVGFREAATELRRLYDDVESGKQAVTLCDVARAALQTAALCSCGLLDLGFKRYLVETCQLNFDQVRLFDSWDLIDATCTAIVGDSVQMQIMSGVTVFNETDIGSNFNVNYHFLVRNDIGKGRLGNYELLSQLASAQEYSYDTKQYTSLYQSYFGRFYQGGFNANHAQVFYNFSQVSIGGALYDVLMEQKLYLLTSSQYGILTLGGVDFELAALNQSIQLINEIYGLTIEVVVDERDLSRQELIARFNSCPSETCDARYHLLLCYLEKDAQLDYAEQTLIGNYSLYGKDMTADEFKNVRSGQSVDKKFCYLESEELYSSNGEYNMVQKIILTQLNNGAVKTYADLFAGDCQFTYGLREEGLQMIKSSASFTMEDQFDVLAQFLVGGYVDDTVAQQYVGSNQKLNYERDTGEEYESLTTVMSTSILVVLVSAIVLVALN